MYRAVLKSQPDRALAALAAGGSEPAFEAIVLRYRRPLLGYCRRLRLSENRSEDVVQQTFINAWGSLQRGVEVQDLRPWLYRITHNQAVSILRRPGADDASLTDLLDHPATGPELLGPSSSVEEIVERQARLRETLQAVADLPVLQRDALLATAVDGLSYEQVAVALNTTGDAVRGLVYRARNHLRAGVAAISPAPLVFWAAQHTCQPVTATVVAQWLTGAGTGVGPAGLGVAAVKSAAVVASSAAVIGGTVGAGLDPGLLGRAPHPAPATGVPAATGLAPPIATPDRRPGPSAGGVGPARVTSTPLGRVGAATRTVGPSSRAAPTAPAPASVTTGRDAGRARPVPEASGPGAHAQI